MDDAHEKPRPEPPREIAPRDDVHVAGSPVRCPFCHTDVAIEGDWSACARCLARHHQACWTEGGRCGSCGHDAAVRHERAATKVVPEVRTSSAKAIGAALLLAVIGLAVIVFLGYLRAASSRNAATEAFQAQERLRAAQEVRVVQGAQARHVARYERDGALVVEDGRGNFVLVVRETDEIAFGIGMVPEALDARRLVVVSPRGESLGAARPFGRPLTVLQDSRRSSPARPGMTAIELEQLLTETRPEDVDVEELLRRAQGE